MRKHSTPTLTDVARLAGVSTATVSRCLNEPALVGAETRERVLRAVDALAYTPNFGGRALASQRTNTVGAIIPTMENAIFARGIQAFEEELAGAGYTLLVGSTGYDPEREYEQVIKLAARGADGLLLIGWERPGRVIGFVKARNFPTVIAWNYRRDEDLLCAGFDNRLAARRMAERVIAHGHQNIAMIAGIVEGNDRAADRVAGVRQALEAAGLDARAMTVIEAPYTLENGGEALRRLMALKPRPTAVVCGNDVLAAGALCEAKAMGLAIPGDLSITGFDNIDLSTVVDPPLTTVHVPHRRMGHAAARILLDRMSGGNEVESALFETEIVERGTLGPPPARLSRKRR